MLLNCKEIQPVEPKGNQSWIFTGRTDAEAETPILWPPDAKSWLIQKDPDAGKDWGHKEKGMTEDEMAGWHHQLDGHGFGWTLGVGDGQGGLACCGSWGHKESDTTEWLNWTEVIWGKLVSMPRCRVRTYPYRLPLRGEKRQTQKRNDVRQLINKETATNKFMSVINVPYGKN